MAIFKPLGIELTRQMEAAFARTAPKATDPGRFEDYARKMYPQYNRLNVPTWIIGPALGEGPFIDRPADVLKVWPRREPIQRLPPVQFNPGIAVNAVADRGSGFSSQVATGRVPT